MSEFIDREKAIANIKAAYCCGCEHYNGVRCRACQIMDAMDVLEDEPAVVPDVQRWRKTAEEPPTEADANEDGDVLSINNNPCDGFITIGRGTWWQLSRKTSRSGCRCLKSRVNTPKSFTGVKKQSMRFAPFAGIVATMIITLTNIVPDAEHAFGLTGRKPNMINLTCKDCPDRHPICHDSCPKYAEYKRQLKAQRIYTNGNHAAERISRNDFDKEGWMGGRKR